MKKRVCAFLIAALLVLGVLAGCGGSGEVVSVQAVSLITGVGSTTGVNRFAGVVTSSKTINIQKASDLSVAEVLVKQGDTVSAGQVLFTYDVEVVQLAVDKLGLEIQQLEIQIASLEKSEAAAKQKLDKANNKNRLEREIAWQEVSIQLKEAQYNLEQKQTSLSDKEKMLINAEVKSEVDGIVQSINESENSTAYMSIMEVGAYRVKGIISEMNSSRFSVGTQVLIRSRVDDSVWYGSIESIDWDNPQRDQNEYYGNVSSSSGSDVGGAASKYPFYVKLDTYDGLMLGQHVYIEAYLGQPDGEGMWLPSYYIVDAEGDAYVWAADDSDKLEKRSIKLGEYDADSDTYNVLSGLSANDSIAYPDENCSAGATVEYYDESAFSSDMPAGEEFMGEEYMGEEYTGEEPVGDDLGATSDAVAMG